MVSPFKSNLFVGPESIYNMETCNVLLTLESVEEILWCHHSNQTSLSALSEFIIWRHVMCC